MSINFEPVSYKRFWLISYMQPAITHKYTSAIACDEYFIEYRAGHHYATNFSGCSIFIVSQYKTKLLPIKSDGFNVEKCLTIPKISFNKAPDCAKDD